MGNVIYEEMFFFCFSVSAGIVCLSAYDILRLFRAVVPHNNLWVGVEDFVFWCVYAVFLFRMMCEKNDGILRGFSFVGVFLGMLVYKHTISQIFTKKSIKKVEKRKKTE